VLDRLVGQVLVKELADDSCLWKIAGGHLGKLSTSQRRAENPLTAQGRNLFNQKLLRGWRAHLECGFGSFLEKFSFGGFHVD